MITNRKLWQFLLPVALLLGLLAPATVPAAHADQEPPHAHPALLQLAAEHPDDTMMVIIQRAMKNKELTDDDPEIAVEKAGGKVKKQLPMIESFAAELAGKEIEKLAKNPKVRWLSLDAPMMATGAAGLETLRDEFTNGAYSGNNGTVNWNSNWLEVGENTNATSGLIQVVSNSACAGGAGACLRLDPYMPTGNYVYRQADLSGFVSVWLTFYRNNQLNANSGGALEQVQLQISSDGGANWTTLATYTGASNVGTATDSFDISPYATANTQVRFRMPTYQTGVRYIYFDDIQIDFARPSPFLSTIKADQLNLNGQGVTVAVVDSGITSTHPDFMTGNNTRVIVNTKFGNNLTAQDVYGHGTHVAGILGGNGAASAGKYRGVAPGVNLINIKVSDANGMTYESSVVDALQWIYNNKNTYNIRVVNLSMNSAMAQSYHSSPLDAAVEILWFNGIVVVVSAGNNGSGTGPVALYPPANDPFVITVGATEEMGTALLSDDALASFSAYGTTEDGFTKPDLVAPGRNVVAPLGGLLNIIFQQHTRHRVNDYYFRMSGTSMATPMVSGAVALLLQDEPTLTPDQVKYRLKATANTTWPGYNVAQAGAGYLDSYAAVYGTTTTSANVGLTASQLLSTGSSPLNSSVSWNSVSWNSVSWNSVSWNSDYWSGSIWDSEAVSASNVTGNALMGDLNHSTDATQNVDLPMEQAAEAQVNRLFLPLVNR